MTTTEERALAGPERAGGQGLDVHQEESGNQAIHLVLTDPVTGPQTDFVATYRDDAYEAWSLRGMVRFQRTFAADGGHDFHVVETIGRNPLENQDPHAVGSLEAMLEAARRSGHETDDPNHAYIEPEHLSHPMAYERIAQLFDSPNAPDIVINAKTYAHGNQPGQHGALDIVQSRAPLIFSGPGVRQGVSDGPARHIDIAPTIARLLGFPHIKGIDGTGRPSNEVYFRRQDGRPLDEILELEGDGESATRAERAYIFHLDGQSAMELHWRLENQPDAIPNLRRLIDRGHRFEYGSIVNFPSITWPSHNTIGTGCWGGHHDLVNNHYYLRETREVVSPFNDRFNTAKYLGDQVETLHEAFHRVFGEWQGNEGAFTAAIHEPCSRGADHTVLERRVIGNRDRLRSLTIEAQDDVTSRWLDDGSERMHQESIIDSRGIAQVLVLFTEDDHPPPAFTYHQFMLTDGTGHDYGPHHEAHRAGLDETDKRIGRVLSMLDDEGMFESTLFIVAADHGMAPTKAELAANQAALLPQRGMKAHVPENWAYFLDMSVTVETTDGTVTVTVGANDADTSGKRPPVAGADVTLRNGDAELARATTNGSGVATLTMPDGAADHELVIAVEHIDYNPRHLRLDGSSVVLDLREALYGSSG